MNARMQPLAALNDQARLAVIQALGVVDAARYFHQFTAGSGDYTAQREQLFKGDTVKSIVADIKAQRPPR